MIWNGFINTFNIKYLTMSENLFKQIHINHQHTLKKILTQKYNHRLNPSSDP